MNKLEDDIARLIDKNEDLINYIEQLEEGIDNLKEKIIAAKNCLVCAAIASPYEVCVNTLEILGD
jgi:hypothetical protein